MHTRRNVVADLHIPMQYEREKHKIKLKYYKTFHIRLMCNGS